MGIRTRALLVVGAIATLLVTLVAGCGAPTGLAGQLTVVGSTALQPLVDEAARQFMVEHPQAQITVNGGGSGFGLTQVATGAAQIGNSDIFANEKPDIDASALEDHKVAVVGIAAVVNPNVGIDNVTQAQLIDIFTGKVTNWQQVGGHDVKITVVSRAKGSGTRATFKQYALLGNEEMESQSEDSSGAVRKIVAETPGAISYLALSYIDSSVRALKLNGVEPTAANIANGTYPVWAYEHMYTKGPANGLAKAFIDYILSDKVQRDLIPKLGYIPVVDMKASR